MMYRLKTTTEAGKVFLGPFVYTEDFAERRVRKISSWHRKPTIQILKVDRYPKIAMYAEDASIPLSFNAWVTRCNFAWANLKGGDKDDNGEDA